MYDIFKVTKYYHLLITTVSPSCIVVPLLFAKEVNEYLWGGESHPNDPFKVPTKGPCLFIKI